MNFRVEQSNGEYGRWRLTDGGKDVVEFDADFETAAGAAEGSKLLVLKATKLWGMTGEVVERCAKYVEELRRGRTSAGPSVAQLQAAAIAVADAAADGSRAEPVLRCFADIEPRQVDWLWAGRVPAGRITLLVGRPGEGKSFLTTDLAARVSRGGEFPDGAPCPQGDVLFITAEDDPSDTIRPRLDAHGADAERIHLLSGKRITDQEGKKTELFFTLSDLETIRQTMRVLPRLKLIVIDPIGSFLGAKTDSDKDNAVRAVLSPIAQLAEKSGAAVLIVAHRRKSSADFADDTALGSKAFTGIARAVWHVTRDPNNKFRRMFLAGKNNLAPEGQGLAFTIDGVPPRLFWETAGVGMNADEGMRLERQAEHDRPGPAPVKTDAAAQWLSVQAIARCATRRDAVELVGAMIRGRVAEPQRMPARVDPLPVAPLPPADPPEDPLARLRVLDDKGNVVGTLGQIAELTGRTISAAHDEIEHVHAIDGMAFRFSDGSGRPRGAAVRILRINFNNDGTRRLFDSASAAAAASGVDATTVMRAVRRKRRTIIDGFAFELADPPAEVKEDSPDGKFARVGPSG